MRESVYQAQLIVTLKRVFPGCMVLKNDTDYMQGIPDLLILYGVHWAALEVKADYNSPYQPNQEYYLDLMNDMSFAAVIYPEIEEEVLYDLQQAFGSRRPTRVSQRQ